jgi:hypothetical protein
MKRKPRKLYKYVPARWETIGTILVDNCVFFSSPARFNDPFDCARGVRFPDPDNLTQQDEDDWRHYFMHLAQNLKDADAAFCNGKHRDKAFVKECEGSIEKEILSFGQKLGVLCLSETPASVSMWAHYGSNHKGVLIEFEHDRLPDDRDVVRSFPVRYCDHLPTLREYLGAARSSDWSEFPKLFLCRKSTEWAREREWRFFTKEPNQYCDLPLGAVTRVIFGYRMPAKTRDLIAASVCDRDTSIKFAEAVPSRDRFEMILKNVRR